MKLSKIRDLIRNHPNYELLIKKDKAHIKRLNPYREYNRARIDEEPEDILSIHSGFWNAKSQACLTTKRLAREIIDECNIPTLPIGQFRGESERLDWNKIEEDIPK